MTSQIKKIKISYAAIGVLSTISILWYITKIVIVHTSILLPAKIDATISYVISFFILIDLIIMCVIHKHSYGVNNKKLIKWSRTSIVIYLLIILLNILQGTFPLFKFSNTHVTGTGLPVLLLFLTIINFITITKSKNKLNSYNV